jgi:GntR family transcriptional repressor for pyruvate dehydrogenase complex
MTSRVSSQRALPAPLSQTDVVIQELKRLVVEGALGPGSRLPIEKELAAQLGVSRGSLREGVRALVHLGVLETRQGDGTYVTELDAGRLLSSLGFLAELPTNAAELLSVRRILEAESAALAALIENLIGRTERTRVIRAMSDRGAVHSTQSEHYAILSQLQRHDPQRARIRMEAHLLGVEDFARAHPNDTLAAGTAVRERQ